ncbi:MAG: carbon-nitrogen hydrolase family protein [Xanthomonadales bacterium]|nr:carbon-nitrogen hydrolase family protein [Xanthomonadales bacterium]
MPKVRIAVAENAPDLMPGTSDWERLVKELQSINADIFVFNELPFGDWIASEMEFDEDIFNAAVAAHDTAIEALGTLGVPNILGSRITVQGGVRVNSGFLWTKANGLKDFYTKQHVPFSPGYWESSWYEPGPRTNPIIEVAGLKIGMLICTDIMFNEHARAYGRGGADVIVVPRAMPPVASDFFDAAMTMGAVASGCYVASSNRTGENNEGEPFEGRGCIYNPAGQVVAQTNMFTNVSFHDVDTDFVTWKQALYPCDVPE